MKSPQNTGENFLQTPTKSKQELKSSRREYTDGVEYRASAKQESAARMCSENFSPGKKRTVTAESEKHELFQRLTNSPYIRKHQLETPEDASLRIVNSHPTEAVEEDQEKLILEELTRINKKIEGLDLIAHKILNGAEQKRNYIEIIENMINQKKTESQIYSRRASGSRGSSLAL
jgi:hypothetical protein